ncbi:MAG: hypothetical protein ACMXYG_00370 [Candidatus Woesearchaeota archaeon]
MNKLIVLVLSLLMIMSVPVLAQRFSIRNDNNQFEPYINNLRINIFSNGYEGRGSISYRHFDTLCRSRLVQIDRIDDIFYYEYNSICHNPKTRHRWQENGISTININENIMTLDGINLKVQHRRTR